MIRRGRQGSTDRLILRLGPGFYLSLRLWRFRLRASAFFPYRLSFSIHRIKPTG
jgi:hypothetical protein